MVKACLPGGPCEGVFGDVGGDDFDGTQLLMGPTEAPDASAADGLRPGTVDSEDPVAHGAGLSGVATSDRVGGAAAAASEDHVVAVSVGAGWVGMSGEAVYTLLGRQGDKRPAWRRRAAVADAELGVKSELEQSSISVGTTPDSNQSNDKR